MKLFKLTAGSMVGSAEFIILAQDKAQAKWLATKCIAENYADSHGNPEYFVHDQVQEVKTMAAKVISHQDTSACY